MVKIKKTAIFSMVVILCLCCNLLTSCSDKYSFEEVRQEFSRYEADLNVGVVLDSRNLYFYDRSIELEEMIPEGDVTNFQFIGDNIYFTATKSGWWSFSADLLVYKYNLTENNVVCLFKKENLKTPLKQLFNGETLYFQYKIKGSSDKIIDSYHVITEEYKNIACGKDCNINNYKEVVEEKYSYTLNDKNNEFSIKEIESSEIFVGDEEYLKRTPYYDSLNKYSHELDHIRENKGRIYIVYRLFIEGSFSINTKYTFVIFEFDFINKTLLYKSIVQMPDIEMYTIINIGE